MFLHTILSRLAHLVLQTAPTCSICSAPVPAHEFVCEDPSCQFAALIGQAMLAAPPSVESGAEPGASVGLSAGSVLPHAYAVAVFPSHASAGLLLTLHRLARADFQRRGAPSFGTYFEAHGR